MVEKTQRAIRILQQRQTSSTSNNRTTEEVVADLQVGQDGHIQDEENGFFLPKSPQTRANLAILEVTINFSLSFFAMLLISIFAKQCVRSIDHTLTRFHPLVLLVLALVDFGEGEAGSRGANPKREAKQ